MPGTVLDTTVLSPALKQKYTQKRFNLLCLPDNPLYALMAKMTDFGGKNEIITVRNAVPQGRGPTIAIAQGAKTASVYNGFVITRSFDYSTATITGETIRAAKGDENALIEGLTKEIDGAIHVLVRSLAIQMYRNGGGARGQLSTLTSFTYPGTGGATVTVGVGTTLALLNNASDISNFEPGMFTAFSADDGTGGAGLRSTINMVQVVGVDRDNSILTMNANLNTAGAVAGDYLFQGAPSLGSDYNSMVRGLAAWIPLQPPATTDNFFGVNRSQDSRLYGLRQVGGGAPIEDTIADALSKVALNGGKTSHLMLHPLDWSQLVKALSTKVNYPRERVNSNDEPDIGFTAIEVYGPKGPVKVVADLNCPKGYGYALQLDTWHLDSLGEAPMILDDDGLIILRSPNADAYDVRCGYYANVVCEAPIWNAVLTF